MPRLPFDKLDILIVDEIGKEISGAGMDPNVIGRRMVLGEPEPTPHHHRIVLRDLTDIPTATPSAWALPTSSPSAWSTRWTPAHLHQLPHRHDT